MEFIIKSNDESKVKVLFGDSTIRSWILAQPSILFELRGNVLLFEDDGVIRNLERLKSIYLLLVKTLNHLEKISYK